ncbi:hypothetical protein NQ317_001276 [Molorchus minor]|uniref:Uncharacterized protein n=1 Tax=Molorchus minor TaxID=1323400 RepID=A0ABQ9ISG0_9CUCU|nr:hypothetical protein NQ317_001276 [Molorchus minor]
MRQRQPPKWGTTIEPKLKSGCNNNDNKRWLVCDMFTSRRHEFCLMSDHLCHWNQLPGASSSMIMPCTMNNCESERDCGGCKYCNKQFTAYEVKIFMYDIAYNRFKSGALRKMFKYTARMFCWHTSVKMQKNYKSSTLWAIFYG